MGGGESEAAPFGKTESGLRQLHVRVSRLLILIVARLILRLAEL